MAINAYDEFYISLKKIADSAKTDSDDTITNENEVPLEKILREIDKMNNTINEITDNCRKAEDKLPVLLVEAIEYKLIKFDGKEFKLYCPYNTKHSYFISKIRDICSTIHAGIKEMNDIYLRLDDLKNYFYNLSLKSPRQLIDAFRFWHAVKETVSNIIEYQVDYEGRTHKIICTLSKVPTNVWYTGSNPYETAIDEITIQIKY